MSRKVYLYFALTFLFGVVVGACGFFYYSWYTGGWHRRPSPERIIQHLKRELKLSDTQVQQVREIFADTSKKMDALQEQVEPQFQAVHQEARSRVRQILNPQQAQQFDELVRRLDERRKLRQHRH
jgi:hypothetical protein